MTAALAATEICVFDAYGTLFDFNSASPAIVPRSAPGADALADLWRAKQIQYTWLRNSMGAYDKFWQVTGEALDHCLAAHGIRDAGVRDKLMLAYLALDAFPEVPAMLDKLKRAASGSPSCRTQSRDARPHGEGVQPGRRFEAVLSVDDAKVFKPDARVYRLVEQRCGVKPDKVCFLSSNGWDAHGAAHFGFATVWVNRAGAPGRQPARQDRGGNQRPLSTPFPARCFLMSASPTFDDVLAPPPPPRGPWPSARRCSRTRASTRGWRAPFHQGRVACSAPARSSCAAPTISRLDEGEADRARRASVGWSSGNHAQGPRRSRAPDGHECHHRHAGRRARAQDRQHQGLRRRRSCCTIASRKAAKRSAWASPRRPAPRSCALRPSLDPDRPGHGGTGRSSSRPRRWA